MNDCIFCKIANGEIPSNKVYEDDKILAFHDLSPVSPVHVLIIPKVHLDSVNEITDENISNVSHIFLKAKEIASMLGVESTGYRLVANTGIEGGQTVEHLHFHLMGGRKFIWPPG